MKAAQHVNLNVVDLMLTNGADGKLQNKEDRTVETKVTLDIDLHSL